MKTLLLLRHAQAARGPLDHDRPLDATGRAEADQAGRLMMQAGLRPTVALVSDARRTRETFAGVTGVLGPVREILEPRLYDASPDTILDLLKGAPEPDSCLLVIGHNPGLGEVARLLAAEGRDDALAALRQRFPTGANAVLAFDAPRWSALGDGGRLRALLLAGS